MIRLLQVFANISCEDTALNAMRGLQEANAARIFSLVPYIFVTLTAFTYAISAYSAPAATAAVTPSTNEAPLVALASSFRSVWPILMEAYGEELDSRPPRASFASSGLLSTQILRGAPFELFLSADQRSVTRIMEAGKTQTDPFALASGALSLVTLPGASSLSDGAPTLELIKESMAMGNSLKIAIPNPRHAPYGIAAQQALTTAGLWPIPRGSLLNAENASQALQYVLGGAAFIAIVPTTLVTQIPFDINITPIDPSSYEPVIHHLAILAPAGDNARNLSNWLKTPRALNIMMQFGLSHPKK
jgi:molybdate transport system substrate-binding protein